MTLPVPSRIVYFGDSFTDAGALFAATARVLVAPFPIADAGYAGGFSNGEVYAQVAPALLGAAVENFAVGGARAVGSRSIQQFLDANTTPEQQALLVLPGADAADLAFDTNLGAQTLRFLASVPGGAEPGTAASYLIGLNDYGNFAPSSPEAAADEAAALVQAVLGATFASAAAALAAGVETVIFNTLPSLSFLPAAAAADPALLALADQIVAAHNAGLALGAAGLAALGVDARVVDLGGVAAEIADDPGAFGFAAPLAQPVLLGDAGDPTLTVGPGGEVSLGFPANPAVAGFDPDQIAFFDFLHPSFATHGVFGAFQARALTAAEAVFLGAGADVFEGGAGSELAFGGRGADRLTMGGGDDVAFGGLGRDLLRGGGGDDILQGGGGGDLVLGGAGCDVVAGGAGCDILRGGRGADVLIDGAGGDLAFGGRGADVFLYVDPRLAGGAPSARGDRFVGGAGRDTAYLAVSGEARAVAEDELAAAGGGVARLRSLGLTLVGIETVIFVDDRADLADVASFAPLAEADLWGLV